jgi:hypothetical protein
VLICANENVKRGTLKMLAAMLHLKALLETEQHRIEGK